MTIKKKQTSKKKTQKSVAVNITSKTKSDKKTISSDSANKTRKSIPIIGIGASTGGQEALRLEVINEKNRLQAVMAALPVGVSILDEKGGNPKTNRKFEQIWGGPPPTIKSIQDYVKYKAWWADTGRLVKPDEWASAQAVKEGKTVTGQLFEIERFDGRRAYVLNSAAPILDADGKITGSAVAIEDITERKRAEEALRASQQSLALAQAIAHLGNWSWDIKTNKQEWSDETFRIFGFEPGECQPDYDLYLGLLHPEDRGRLIACLRDALERNTPFHIDYRILRRDGSVRYVHSEGQIVRDDEGQPLRVFGTNQDITERKRAEQDLSESRNKYQALIETTADFIWEMDASGKYTYCSPQMKDLWGYEPKDMIGKTPFDVMPPEDRKEAIESFMALARSPKPFTRLEASSYDRQGRLIAVEISGVPFFDADGRLLGYRGISRDVTERQRSEQAMATAKTAAEAAAEAKSRFLAVVDSTSDGVVILSAVRDPGGSIVDFRYEYINEAGALLNERPVAEHLGKTVLELLPAHEGTELWDEYIRVTKQGGTVTKESLLYEDVYGGGQRLQRAFDIRASKLDDGLAVLWRDVTPRYRAEEALRESEEKFRLLAETSPAAILIYQDGKYVYVNPATESITGYTRSELLAQAPGNIVQPDYHEQVKQMLSRREQGEEPPVHYELEILTKDGQRKWMDCRTVSIRYENKPAGLVVAFDITERKLAEEALRRSQQDLKLAQTSAGAGVWDWDITTDKLEWSEELFDLFGLDPAKDEASLETWRTILHPDDRPVVQKQIEEAIENRTPLNSESRIVLDSGQVRWITALGDTVYDDEGKPQRMSGICINITERKKSEEAIRNSEEQFRRAIQEAPIPVIMHAEDGEVLQLSRTWTELTGYSKEDIRSFDEWTNSAIYGRGANEVRNYIRSLFSSSSNSNSSRVEFPIITRTGEIRYWSFSASAPGHLLDGRRFLVGMALDITDRKQAEMALQKEKESYQTLAENLPALVYRIHLNEQCRMEFFNQSLVTLTGYTQEELTMGEVCSIEPLIEAEDREIVVAAVEKAIHEHQPFVIEYRLRTKTGELRHFAERGRPIYTHDGDCTHIDGVIFDITERKAAEEQIQTSAKFPEENPFPVLRLSKEGELLYSNTPGKVILEQWNCEIGQKAPQEWRQLVLRALKSKNYLVKEIDCGKKIYSCAIAPVPAGGYVNLYGRDITKQRDVILSLQKSEQKFRLFSETAGQLLQSKNPLGLAETLCRKVMEYLDCHAFFHYLIDDEKQCLHLNACAGISKTTAGKIEWLDYGTSVCGCVAGEGKRIVTENIPESRDPRTNLVRSLGIKAYACHPLTSHGRVIGTLSFGTCTRTTFSKENLNVMKTVADQVATAMARVKSEETIRKSEEHIRSQLAEIESIYNTAVIGLCVFDRQMRYMRVNQHMAEMNSMPIDEHIGKTMREVAPKLASTMEKVARKVFRTGEPTLDVEINGMTATEPGLLHYWKQQWLPIKDEAGKVTAINVVSEDITEIKRIEQSLIEINHVLGKKVQTQSQELSRTASALQQEVAERVRAETDLKERTQILDAFFAHTITPLVILDRKFNFVRVNQAYADSCQRDISEFYGHNHFEFYPNEENEQIFKKVVRTKKPYQTFAKPFIYADHPEWGTTYWDWTLSPIISEKGRVESLVFSLMDVTQRRLAEIALQDSEEKYRSLIEFSPEGVCVLIEEKIAFINTAAVKLLKAKIPQDVVGRSMWDFISADSAQMAQSDMKEILEQHHKISPREIKLNCLDGSPIEIETSATSVFHQGKPGMLVLFHDITERKSAQARMNVTNSLLELFAQKTSRQEYMDSVVEIIRNWSGCRCVGIRLTNADGLIPYESYTGFSEKFLSLENRLCLKTDSCLCIRAISQTSVSHDEPLLTTKGSFRTDNSLEFVKSLPKTAKKKYHSNCIQFGFTSLAVIPIRYRDKILGAIHLADEDRNKAPLETVEFLEDMGALIGEAVHRFNVEQSLRLNEKRLTEAQKLAHLGNWEWDIPANRLWWSDEVYRIFGFEPSLFGITYEAFVSCIHPDDRKFVEESINKSLHQGKEYNINYRIIRPDGTERIILVKAELTTDANHKPIKMTGTVYDITEQKQAENEIRENQQSLRVLAAELQLAEERERRRIAQDLHDSIGQILAFSGRELKSLQKSLPEKTAKTIEEITNQLDTAVEQSRTLSFDLSPSALYDLGFEVAVEDLVDRTSKTRNIPCYFENRPSVKPLSDDVKILLYRSVRELLINAVKHANAGAIKVSLSKKNSNICIQVEDDGCGFDASILESSSTKSKGFGIFSIRERLSHIGGRLEIESAKGKGTKAILIAPLDIERQEQEVSL